MSQAPPSNASPALEAFAQRREIVAGEIAKLEKQVGAQAGWEGAAALQANLALLKLPSLAPALPAADLRVGVGVLYGRLHKLRQRRQGESIAQAAAAPPLLAAPIHHTLLHTPRSIPLSPVRRRASTSS